MIGMEHRAWGMEIKRERREKREREDHFGFRNPATCLAPQDNSMIPLPSRDCVAICHPGQVPHSGTRAGIQKKSDYIEPLLDSGSRPPEADSSGMTGSANCDAVSSGGRDFCGGKQISVLQNSQSAIRNPQLPRCLVPSSSCLVIGPVYKP